MKKLPDLSCDFSKKSKNGFALVLALSLMSLVFLLVVSLVSLVSTDLNLSELRKQKVLAQYLQTNHWLENRPHLIF